MPVKRGKDGKPVETKTHKPNQTQKSARNLKNSLFPGEDEARKIDKYEKNINRPDPETKLYKGGKEDNNSNIKTVNDPVVAWLVIMNGPGKGNSLTLGYGANSIGRSDSERVSLNFGDEEISRESHSIITFDPKSRRYFIQQGTGKNLTYLDEQPVLAPTELSGHNVIALGNTTLRLVPFCDKDFDWQD